jgi:putative flippase GtrA
LKRFLNSPKNRERIAYLIFGVLTTIVNWICYALFYNRLGTSATTSNIIAWFVSVLFAYFTNKQFVFRSYNWSIKVIIPEMASFFGSRFISGCLETAIIALTIDYLGYGFIWKIIASVIVVILNYIFSTIFVFRKK